MKISVSILDCFDRVDGVKMLNGTRVDYIHVDVMDGKFVPNVQFNDIEEIKEIDRVSDKKLDVHLMVDNPDDYVSKLSIMNIRYVTVHIESLVDIKDTIKKIRDMGYGVGISLKPNTDIIELIPYLSMVDLILVMSVEPGIGGQKFLNNTISRIKEIKKLVIESGRNIEIEVDGGVNRDIIKNLEDVDIAVVGSYITKSSDYGKSVDSLFD